MNEDRMDPRGVVWKVNQATIGRRTVWVAECGCPSNCGSAFVSRTKTGVQRLVQQGGRRA